jgi:hypothetical protein
MLQANIGFNQDMPGVGLGQWYGMLVIGVLRVLMKLDAQALPLLHW